MASSKDYLLFVLDSLCELDGITYRRMMGEYVLYYGGKVAAFICDDRLLVKNVPAAHTVLPNPPMQKLFEGSKDMIFIEDVENRQLLCDLFTAIYPELPEPKPKKPRRRKEK